MHEGLRQHNIIEAKQRRHETTEILMLHYVLRLGFSLVRFSFDVFNFLLVGYNSFQRANDYNEKPLSP